MIIAVAGGKGSPGATAVAALLAAAWPRDDDGPPVLLEADPEGGVLAARWHHGLGVTHDPGLLSLAAARDGSALERLRRHSQAPATRGPGGRPAGRGAGRGLPASSGTAAEALQGAPVVCVVDCGRLHPASPALPWARAADHLLLVARPRLDEVVTLAPPPSACGGRPVTDLGLRRHLAVRSGGGGRARRPPVACRPRRRSGGFAALFADGPGARRGAGRLRRSVAALVGALGIGPVSADEQAVADRVGVR